MICATSNFARRQRPGAHGFTLVEVLVTMVLLAIILPVTMEAASIALRSASSARHTTEAATLGQAKLNELLVTDQWSQPTSGDFSPTYPDYHWSLQSSVRDYGIYDVSLTVTWSDRGQQEQLVLSTLAYPPVGSVEGLQ